MTPEERDEEQAFRRWVRTLPKLPAEVGGDERWNGAVLMDTFEKINQPMPNEM